MRAPRSCASRSARQRAGDDDRVRAIEIGETKRRVDEEAGLSAHGRAARSNDHELVPGRRDVAAVETEHFARNREVEGQSAFVDDGRDDVHE